MKDNSTVHPCYCTLAKTKLSILANSWRGPLPLLLPGSFSAKWFFMVSVHMQVVAKGGLSLATTRSREMHHNIDLFWRIKRTGRGGTKSFFYLRYPSRMHPNQTVTLFLWSSITEGNCTSRIPSHIKGPGIRHVYSIGSRANQDEPARRRPPPLPRRRLLRSRLTSSLQLPGQPGLRLQPRPIWAHLRRHLRGEGYVYM